MKKKIIKIFMMMLMIMALSSVNIFAEERYDEIFEVNSGKEIQDAVENINKKNGGSYLIKLTKDIELLPNSWTPYPALNLKKNNITIWGQNHKISAGSELIKNGSGSLIGNVYGENVTLTLGKSDGTDKLLIEGISTNPENVSNILSIAGNNKIIMNDGVILEGNVSKVDTGAVYMSGDSPTFEMNGGEIRNNTVNVTNTDASRLGGGAVYIWKGTFTMNGGKITNNKVTSNGNNATGGAIMVLDMIYQQGQGASRFIMNGGEISNNSATDYGGAIWAQKDTTVTLNKGIIKNNKARYGGALFAFPFSYSDSNSNGVSKYSEIKYLDREPTGDEGKYNIFKISDNMIFKDNVATEGVQIPPLNSDDFTNLKFDRTTVKDKKSLLNNNDINYISPFKNLTFQANDGYFSDGSIIKTIIGKCDEKVNLLEAPTREHYTFDYWGGSRYEAGAEYIIKGDHIFVAKWKNNSPIIKVKDAIIKKNEKLNLSDLIIEASDIEDKDLGKKDVTIDPSNIDTTITGKVKVKFSLRDKSGDKETDTTIAYANITVIEEKKPEPKPEPKPQPQPKAEKKTYFSFSSVKPIEEIYKHIEYLSGYPDFSVRADANVKRAEAVTMLVRLKGYTIEENYKEIYKDVKEKDWYSKYILTAYREGILEEKEGENFRPNDNMTRAELAQLISHVDKNNSAKAPFTDIEGHKYIEAINKSYGNNRIKGYPDNTFRPDQEITRAETVTMLNNLFDRKVRERGLKEVEVKKYIDLDKNHWAYYEIIEASHTHEYKTIEGEGTEEEWIRIIK